MYRVSADRAVSYAYLIIIGSCRHSRNLPEVRQHLIEQSVDTLHKIMGLDLTALHPQQVIFPLSCHAGGFQVVRDIADRSHTVLRVNHLLTLTLNIAGGYQLFQNSSARCRGSQTLFLGILFKFFVACRFHGRKQGIFRVDFRRRSKALLFLCPYHRKNGSLLQLFRKRHILVLFRLHKRNRLCRVSGLQNILIFCREVPALAAYRHQNILIDERRLHSLHQFPDDKRKNLLFGFGQLFLITLCALHRRQDRMMVCDLAVVDNAAYVCRRAI